MQEIQFGLRSIPYLLILSLRFCVVVSHDRPIHKPKWDVKAVELNPFLNNRIE